MRPLIRVGSLTSTVIDELLEKRWPNTKQINRSINMVEATEESLSEARRCVNILAESEGLPNHAGAVGGEVPR